MENFIGMKSLLPMAEAINGCIIESINVESKMIELDESRFYRWNAPQSINAVIRFLDQFPEEEAFTVYIKLNAFTGKDGNKVEFLNIVGIQTDTDFDTNGVPTVQAPVHTDKIKTVWRKRKQGQTGDETPDEHHGDDPRK